MLLKLKKKRKMAYLEVKEGMRKVGADQGLSLV